MSLAIRVDGLAGTGILLHESVDTIHVMISDNGKVSALPAMMSLVQAERLADALYRMIKKIQEADDAET